MDGTEFKGDRINISGEVYNKIRPAWMRLSESALLKKCLHGLTQNVNEAFNAFVWQRCPKVNFVGKRIFDISVASGVVDFNDGASGILNIMMKVGLHIGYFNFECSQNTDLRRISKANYKSTESVKKRRKSLHATKKGYDKNTDKDYGAGLH